MSLPALTIHAGDALDVLPRIQAESVQCVRVALSLGLPLEGGSL